MRYKDQIDFTLSAEDAVLVNGALNLLEEKLSFLKALTRSDIRRLATMGLKNETFVMAAIEAAQQNAELIPPGLSLAGIERDRVGHELLAPIAQRVARLNEKFGHTRLLLGADLYGAARAIYKALQEFGRDAGLGDLLDTLSRRFKGQGVKNDASTSTDGGNTPAQQ
jgi:hypothetical protein